MTDRIDTKETTMTTKQYNTEDFANAEFARHPSGVIAARFHDGISMPWLTADEISLSNYDMADYGWSPVREAEPITLDTFQDAWENAEQADECRPGDVVIRPGEGGRYEVIPVEHGTRLIGMPRILHRAPS